jgi:hypothetical protein
LQAQDRAYRIGQQRNVTVYRLIAAHTLEEQIYLRQVAKQHAAAVGVRGSDERRLFTGVQDDRRHRGELYGLVNLFSARAGDLRVQKIRAREEAVEAHYQREAQLEVRAWNAESESEGDSEDEGWADPVEEPDEEDAAGGAMARRLMRHARRNAARADEPAPEGDALDEEEEGAEADPADAERDALAAAGGVRYGYQHEEVLGPNAVARAAAAAARHEDVALPLPLRARPAPEPAAGPAPAARPPPAMRVAPAAAGAPAAPVDVPATAIAMLAQQAGMGVNEYARMLLDELGPMERDGVVANLLMQHNMQRGA